MVKLRSQSSNTNTRKDDFQVMKSNSRLPDYEPLSDKHLNSFMERNRVRRHLLKLGLLKEPRETPHSFKIAEPVSEDLPKIVKDQGLSIPVIKRDLGSLKTSARTFLSKAAF